MNAIELRRTWPRVHAQLIGIRINRAVAWGLLLSPTVPIMMGTGFLHGLSFDLL